ncbi:rCG24290 [Rattus norvegicus]|uniref:RCG24290 n=1 Tax=Rattus norvegicus TaxID=10116 RepID=A6KAT9_RAT|nr:rCG24290 [Rattus norvegicus]
MERNTGRSAQAQNRGMTPNAHVTSGCNSPWKRERRN